MTAIGLRALDVEPDLALVHGWMGQRHVARWWGLGGELAATRDYLSAQTALTHLDCWIASADGEPFAYVETYVVAADPLAEHYAVQPGDRGFHLLAGPPAVLGSGAARELVRRLVSCLLEQPGVTRVLCEPDVRNARMLAFCRALGGTQIATLDLAKKRAALIEWTQPPPAAPS